MSSINEETQNPHHKDYGMFILIIMSHGVPNDCIVGTDGKSVTLRDIVDLLSPINFPMMAGKPKLVAIQACSGG